MIRSFLITESSPEAHDFLAFEAPCNFICSIDKLTEENSEMMIRPYLRLVSFAFPYLVKLFAHQCEELKSKSRQLKALLTSALGHFIECSINLYLSFNISFEEMLPSIDIGAGFENRSSSNMR